MTAIDSRPFPDRTDSRFVRSDAESQQVTTVADGGVPRDRSAQNLFDVERDRVSNSVDLGKLGLSQFKLHLPPDGAVDSQSTRAAATAPTVKLADSSADKTVAGKGSTDAEEFFHEAAGDGLAKKPAPSLDDTIRSAKPLDAGASRPTLDFSPEPARNAPKPWSEGGFDGVLSLIPKNSPAAPVHKFPEYTDPYPPTVVIPRESTPPVPVSRQPDLMLPPGEIPPPVSPPAVPPPIFVPSKPLEFPPSRLAPTPHEIAPPIALPSPLQTPHYADPPFEFKHLVHGSGQTQYPDAEVLVPNNLDTSPGVPVHLVVYNHGFGTTAHDAVYKKRLQEQMESAPANTVMIVPEWQAVPNSRNSSQGNFGAPNQFNRMVTEIFANTPGLEHTTWNDVDKVGIISHSAGYSPTLTELNSNKIYGKVNSIALLDSLYDHYGFDPWIKSHISDFERGTKRFYNISEDTVKQSMDQADRVKGWLPRNSPVMLTDFQNGQTVLSGSDFASHPIVFKYSDKAVGRTGKHELIPLLYVKRIEEAARSQP